MNTRALLVTAGTLLLGLAPSRAQDSQATPTPAITPAPNQIIVNVLGNVKRVDRITLPAGSGLLDAIVAAGGFAEYANTSKIMIIHKTRADKPDVTYVDMTKILSGTVRDIVLRYGDTVEVNQLHVNF
jgi:protein involved in polysaccharide export with SLBB domain